MEKLRSFARWTKLVYTRPWTVRKARINLAMWIGVMLLAMANLGLSLMLDGQLKWLWVIINSAMLCVELVVFKYAVIGLLWRKEQDRLAVEESLITEAFYALVIEEYKSRDRSN